MRATILTAAVLASVIMAPPADARAPMRPCLSDEGESAFACVWQANIRGNLTGHSFRVYRDGRIRLISDRRAAELLAGTS